MDKESSALDINEAWQVLKEEFGVSEETLQVVTSINGYSLSTLEYVLDVCTGYKYFYQWEDN